MTASASWPSSNSTVLSKTGPGSFYGNNAGTAQITASHNGASATKTISVNPPSPLQVTIWGPSQVNPIDNCEWSAGGGGGYPPYTYQWQGIASGSGGSISCSAGSSGTLYLYVTDSKGRVSTASKYIAVTSQQVPGCF